MNAWVTAGVTLVMAVCLTACERTGDRNRGGAYDPLLRLWYRQPAVHWTEALPVGNGRIGAMIFGGPEQEQLQLNEAFLWSGGPRESNNPGGRGVLPLDKVWDYDIPTEPGQEIELIKN